MYELVQPPMHGVARVPRMRHCSAEGAWTSSVWWCEVAVILKRMILPETVRVKARARARVSDIDEDLFSCAGPITRSARTHTRSR